MTNNIKRPASHARTMGTCMRSGLQTYLNGTCSTESSYQSNGAKKIYPVVSTWTLISMPEGSFVLA